MSKIQENLFYTKEHEWLKHIRDNIYSVGISDHAQSSLGDIVYLEIQVGIGQEVKRGQTIGVIESVKAVSDLYSPINGKIISINKELITKTEEINKDCYNNWLVEIEIFNNADLTELLDSNAYREILV